MEELRSYLDLLCAYAVHAIAPVARTHSSSFGERLSWDTPQPPLSFQPA
jgi:hypothetical protein